jgi:hypothetical protein
MQALISTTSVGDRHRDVNAIDVGQIATLYLMKGRLLCSRTHAMVLAGSSERH